MKRTLSVVFALVVVLLVTSLASAGNPDPGIGSVDFYVMNTDPVNTAHVEASYVNQAGVVDYVASAEIGTLSSQSFSPMDTTLPDGWVGSVIVAGDTGIVASALVKWSGGQLGDGKTAGAYNGFNAGSETLYFPSLASRYGKQFSQIAIQSADGPSASESVGYTLTFYNRDGSLAATFADSVLKGAQKTYDLLNLPGTSLPDMWLGAAVVQSDGGALIAGAESMHWRTYTGAYSGVTSAGTTAYLPSATRRIISGKWRQYTALIVQNMNMVDPAVLQVYWYDRDGNELFMFEDTVPANSSHGYNTRWGSSNVPDHAALHSALGDNWNGSVVIQSTTDIVAISNLQWTSNSPVGLAATSYASEPGGSPELFAPAAYRKKVSGTWKMFTGMIVQNVGASDCNGFDVTWTDESDVDLVSYQDSLPPGISHGYNSRYAGTIPGGGDITALGTDFRGSVYINAPGCELTAIANALWPAWTASATYNAFGQ